MAQIVLRDKRVMMVTTVDYPAAIIRDMKQAGYRVVDLTKTELSEYEKTGKLPTRRKQPGA